MTIEETERAISSLKKLRPYMGEVNDPTLSDESPPQWDGDHSELLKALHEIREFQDSYYGSSFQQLIGVKKPGERRAIFKLAPREALVKYGELILKYFILRGVVVYDTNKKFIFFYSSGNLVPDDSLKTPLWVGH